VHHDVNTAINNKNKTIGNRMRHITFGTWFEDNGDCSRVRPARR